MYGEFMKMVEKTPVVADAEEHDNFEEPSNYDHV